MANINVITTEAGKCFAGIKIGSYAEAARGGIAIGTEAHAGCGLGYDGEVCKNSVAIGFGARAHNDSVALGALAKAIGAPGATAIGANATTSCSYPIAIKGGGVCLSANSSGVYLNGTQIGGGGDSGLSCLCVGTYKDCGGLAGSTFLGQGAAFLPFCGTYFATAVGYHALASCRTTAIGAHARGDLGTTALGYSACASVERPIVIKSRCVCLSANSSGVYLNGTQIGGGGGGGGSSGACVVTESTCGDHCGQTILGYGASNSGANELVLQSGQNTVSGTCHDRFGYAENGIRVGNGGFRLRVEGCVVELTTAQVMQLFRSVLPKE